MVCVILSATAREHRTARKPSGAGHGVGSRRLAAPVRSRPSGQVFLAAVAHGSACESGSQGGAMHVFPCMVRQCMGKRHRSTVCPRGSATPAAGDVAHIGFGGNCEASLPPTALKDGDPGGNPDRLGGEGGGSAEPSHRPPNLPRVTMRTPAATRLSGGVFEALAKPSPPARRQNLPRGLRDPGGDRVAREGLMGRGTRARERSIAHCECQRR